MWKLLPFLALLRWTTSTCWWTARPSACPTLRSTTRLAFSNGLTSSLTFSQNELFTQFRSIWGLTIHSLHNVISFWNIDSTKKIWTKNIEIWNFFCSGDKLVHSCGQLELHDGLCRWHTWPWQRLRLLQRTPCQNW